MAKNWFTNLFNKDISTIPLDVCIGNLETKIYYKELILQSAINLIANTISRVGFETFEKGEQTKGKDYYLFNIEPNGNINGSQFWKQVIYQMIMYNEALVIMQDNKLYIAESFNKKEFAFKDNIYTNIVINGFELSGIKSEPEVFYFGYNNEDIEKIISNLYLDYAKLIELNIKSFKREKANKGTLEVPTTYPQTPDAQEKLKTLINERFKDYLNSETDAVLPLTNGLKYVSEEKKTTVGASQSGSGEVRELVNDLIGLISMALNVPPNLLKGTITDASGDINLYIAFCINPIVETLGKEINRKWFTREEYLGDDYIRIETSNIKVTDLKDIAGSLDILTRIGAFNINDSLRKLGMKTLSDDFANVHFMTKNYEPVKTMINRPEEAIETKVDVDIET